MFSTKVPLGAGIQAAAKRSTASSIPNQPPVPASSRFRADGPSFRLRVTLAADVDRWCCRIRRQGL